MKDSQLVPHYQGAQVHQHCLWDPVEVNMADMKLVYNSGGFNNKSDILSINE